MGRKSDSGMKTDTSVAKDGHKGASRFKKERVKTKFKEEIGTNVYTDENIPKTDKVSEPAAFTGDVLERSFQTLNVTDEDDSSVKKPIHQYQLAEERAKHNADVLKEPLKLNRYMYVISKRGGVWLQHNVLRVAD